MSSPIAYRLFTNSIRQVGRSTLRLTFIPHRAASTKLPSGFVAPTKDDLSELRERVQEFTSPCNVLFARK